TPLAVFTSNPNSAFEVGGEGLVKFSGTAEAVVLVRYLEKVSSVRLTYVKVDAQYVDFSGASTYQGGALISDSASLDISGAGKALVNAASLLKVEISGAGAVQYIGNPRIEQEISGVGKITRRNSQ
ncbi:MAG: DUF2807 domain-containing protein, partial [Casimicrobiaceae bacterium]